MKKVAELPKWLRPTAECDLVRLGKDYDGGYLINQSDISRAKILITMGIQEDWSFESDFSTMAEVPVYSYDYSVGLKSWLKCILRPVIKRGNFIETIVNITKPFKFYAFFKGKNRFFREKIGEGVGCRDITSVMGSYDHVFLKIDIEGSEYEILEQILLHESKIVGLAIEFHMLPQRHDVLRNFLERLQDLKIVHIHPNTASGLDEFGNAKVLELTFSNISSPTPFSKVLPNKLDMPNSISTSNLGIEFRE